MVDIKTFVKLVYSSFDKLTCDIEEEQELPPQDVLVNVCQVLLNVSCMREEGRFPNFRVCFLHKDSELLDSYIYSHVLYFKQPLEFNSRNLHKLAPALNPAMSYLMLDISKEPYRAVGIIAAYTTWEKIMIKELESGNRMPRIPNILVNNPGELRFCFGESSIANYSVGDFVFFRTDTFTSTLVAEQLGCRGNEFRREYLQVLYRILWMASKYKHGGAILISPCAEACEPFLDIKYQMPCQFLFNDEEEVKKLTQTAREKEVITYANLIAKLTAVDGSVVLSKNFDLLGFGAETLMDREGSKQPRMCFMTHDNREDNSRQFKDYGMRHRAGYRFCNDVEGSVAFILSQDGSIEACTKSGDKVYVYDKVTLPLM